MLLRALLRLAPASTPCYKVEDTELYVALVASSLGNQVSCAQSLVTYAYCCTTLVGVFLDLEEPECVVLNAVCACLYAASLFTVSSRSCWPD